MPFQGRSSQANTCRSELALTSARDGAQENQEQNGAKQAV